MCNKCGKNQLTPSSGSSQSTISESEPILATSSSPKAQSNEIMSYRIENLTINNYGSIAILSDKPTLNGNNADSTLAGSQKATALFQDNVGSTSRAASIRFSNPLAVTLSSVEIIHQYSSNSKQSHIWTNVAPGATTNADLTANYETGIGTGFDYWWLNISFADGMTFHTSQKECYLTETDSNGHGPLTFTIKDQQFDIALRSTPAQAEFDSSTQNGKSMGYNAFAFVAVQNNFPVPAAITLRHHYHNWTDYTSNYTASQPFIEAGAKTTYWPVYFCTGSLYSDYWNISVDLDVLPPSNVLELAEESFKNDTSDKACMLMSSDRCTAITFTINGTGFHIQVPSGADSDIWKTPAGYNTVSFVKIQNNFNQDIRSVLLQHKYSDDMVYEYDYQWIAKGASSQELNMMEYLTGPTHPGYDYWTISVFLKDETWYQNNKPGKQCYMEPVDATTLTFTVSESDFDMKMPSIGCNDSMNKKGTVDYLLGADINKAYNQNCFLASHNAFANYEDGYIIANQGLGICNQLVMGATTLLLDIWVLDDDIYMLHEFGDELYWKRYLANNLFARRIKLSEGLGKIGSFLNRFTDAVVTIVFEDRIGDQTNQRAKLQSIFATAGLWDLIYQPTAGDKTGTWPTIKEMTDSNKRLVVFTSYEGSDSIFPYQWDYMTENVYGNDSVDPTKWTNVRGNSKPYGELSTLAMNHFPDIQWSQISLEPVVEIESNNAQSFISDHVAAFEAFTPNWLNLDRVDLGGCVAMTKYCNTKLHGEKAGPIRLVQGRFLEKTRISEVGEAPESLPVGVEKTRAE